MEEKKRQRPTVAQVKKLEKENKMLSDENGMLLSKISLLESVCDDRCNEIARLRNRGFWARVFNR